MKRPPKPRARAAHEPGEPTAPRPTTSGRQVSARTEVTGGARSAGAVGKQRQGCESRRQYYTSKRATKEFGQRQEGEKSHQKPAKAKGWLNGRKPTDKGSFWWPWGGKKHPENELSGRRWEIQRAHRRRLIRYFTYSAVVLTVVVALAAVALFSPLFALDPKKVKVTGATKEVPATQVQQMVEPYAKIPLPRVRTAQVAKAVESIALVKSAKVSRHWPRGLEVAITVRHPAMAVAKGNAWEVLDAEGVLLREGDQLEEGLIKAELTNVEGANRAKAVKLIAGVIPALKGEFREQIDTVVSDGVSVEIRTVNGPLIKWGDDSESDFKAQVVQLLMQQRPAQVYDVSTPTRPVTS